MHPLPELPAWRTGALAKDDAPSILRGGEISAKTVFDAVKAGDKVAIEIAEQFGEYLGKGLAAVASVVDPQIFVIGGGVSKAGDILFKYIDLLIRDVLSDPASRQNSPWRSLEMMPESTALQHWY